MHHKISFIILLELILKKYIFFTVYNVKFAGKLLFEIGVDKNCFCLCFDHLNKISHLVTLSTFKKNPALNRFVHHWIYLIPIWLHFDWWISLGVSNEKIICDALEVIGKINRIMLHIILKIQKDVSSFSKKLKWLSESWLIRSCCNGKSN